MMRKLYISLLTLILVGLTLTTSVFAWFQVSRTGMIEGVELGVALDDDLMISLDGIDYYKDISKEMLSSVIGPNPVLKNVTTQDGINFYQGPLAQSSRARPRTEYIAFDIHFRLTSDHPNSNYHQKYVYLSDRTNPTYQNASQTKGTFITSMGRPWVNPISFQNGMEIVPAGTNRVYYAKDAMRISARNADANEVFIYDVSQDRYRGFGKIFGAYDYYINRLGVSLDIPAEPEHTIYQLTEFSSLQNDIALDKRSLLSELSLVSETEDIYVYEGKTTISIWLEGWDADAFDAILSDKLFMRLNIRSARFEEVING